MSGTIKAFVISMSFELYPRIGFSGTDPVRATLERIELVNFEKEEEDIAIAYISNQ